MGDVHGHGQCGHVRFSVQCRDSWISMPQTLMADTCIQSHTCGSCPVSSHLLNSMESKAQDTWSTRTCNLKPRLTNFEVLLARDAMSSLRRAPLAASTLVTIGPVKVAFSFQHVGTFNQHSRIVQSVDVPRKTCFEKALMCSIRERARCQMLLSLEPPLSIPRLTLTNSTPSSFDTKVAQSVAVPRLVCQSRSVHNQVMAFRTHVANGLCIKRISSLQASHNLAFISQFRIFLNTLITRTKAAEE